MDPPDKKKARREGGPWGDGFGVDDRAVRRVARQPPSPKSFSFRASPASRVRIRPAVNMRMIV